MVITFGAIPVSYVHASGTTFTVNSTLDTPDNSPGDGICDDGSGNCTLRAAIEEANVVVSGAVTINFNVAGENIAKQTITLGSSLPSITKDDVTIDASTDQSVNGGSSDGTTCGDLWGVGGSHIDPVWKILITGAGAPVSYVGLSIGSSTSNTVIRGLEMTGFYSGGQASVPALDVDGIHSTITCNYFTLNGKNARVRGSNHMIGGPNIGDGNVFNGNQQNESLPMLDTSDVTVQGNFFGTDVSGTANFIYPIVIPNNDHRGINLEGAVNTQIGGTVFGEGNLFSGNSDGIHLIDSPDTHTVPDQNTIEGNLFGTDLTGLVALGNDASGINIDTATNTLIGGTTSGSRNIISGNTGTLKSGIQLGGSDTRIVGNYIGTDITGTHALGNSIGILFAGGSSANIVGGTSVAEANVISGNEYGIIFAGVGGPVSDNLVEGNYIGVTDDGTTALGNTGYGILLVGSTVTNNTIGGTALGTSNIIANSGHVGISTYDFSGMSVGPAGAGNAFLGNSIYNNGDLGINLSLVESPTADPATPTPNDTLDPDTGPNNLQNYPVLTSATTDGTNTTVIGTLNSLASTSYRIEFFSNTAVDASGYGEGQTYIGYTTVTTDGSGNASFTATGLDNTSVGAIITSTASQDLGSGVYSTSEFSAPPASPVTSVATTHTLTYTAGSHGSLTGTTTQTVNDGSDGTAVTAVPESGYQFSSWSDGSTANPRTDTNVTNDLSVSASFTLLPVSTPPSPSSGGVVLLIGCKDKHASNYSRDAAIAGVCEYKDDVPPSNPLGCRPGDHFSPLSGEKCSDLTVNQAVVTPSFTTNLHLGISDPQVKLLQSYFNTHGYPVAQSPHPGSASHETDYFGPATQAAVIAFQKAHHITPAVGYFGPVTRGAITE